VSLKVIPLLQVFSSAIFGVCGASRGPSAAAELLVYLNNYMSSIEVLRNVLYVIVVYNSLHTRDVVRSVSHNRRSRLIVLHKNQTFIVDQA